MSRRAARTSAVALAVAVGWMGWTGPATAQNLAETLAAAYETNPELISARAALRATDETVNSARAGLRPQVSAGVDYGLSAVDDSTLGSSNNDPFSADITASQPLYDGGQTSNNVRGRIADVSAARARLTGLEQNILLEAARAFLDVRRDEEFVRLARNNVRVIAEQLRASEDRFEVGEVTRTDVSQARARLAEAEANLANVEGALLESQQRYRQVVGTEPQTLAPPPPIPQTPASIEEAVAIALENHPDALAARFDEVSASRDVRAAIGGLLPQISLNASVGYDEGGVFGSADRDTTAATVGIQARIPLYQGGAEYSRIRQTQALVSAARADLTTTARSLRARAEFAWTELEVARATIRAGRQQVEAAQLAFEGVREEAIVGSRTTLDVLDAEQELLDARTQLVSAMRDEYLAAYGLLAAIGRLTAAQQGLAVAAYDPDVNYGANNQRFVGYEASDETTWEEFWRP